MNEKNRDHRTRVTQMLIRRAFTDLLHIKPIQTISIRELCDRAGIHRSTFYAHYTDIYALLNAIEDELMRDFQKSLEPLLRGDGEEVTPLKVVTGIFQCLKENADICTVTLGPYGDKEFANRLINLGREFCIHAYASAFPNLSSRDLEYYYSFVSAGCIGLLQRWLSDGMIASAEDIARMVFRFLPS